MRVHPVCLSVLLVSSIVASSLAQESRATLEGCVRDQHRAVIPNASVQVTSEETGIAQQVLTNNDGLWSVRFLNPGAYTLTITAPNFRTVERKGITLEVADDKTIDHCRPN